MDYVVGLLPRVYKPKEYEEEIKQFWKENKIYEKIKSKLKDRPKFYFLDGPPYPSAETIHIGTAWNKIIKDVIIRYKRSQGFNVRDVPGFDCHGLPIEVAVEKRLGFKSKKDIEEFGVERFVEECRKLALRNVKAMSKQFEDLGVSMDWNHPYLTLNSSYIESAWWLIKRAYERGLIERGLRVLHWCPRCETVLADYEVSEYRIIEDPSIYVKFKVKGKDNEYLVIWTTTPWTLPANVGIMVHPDFDYAKVKVGNEVYIIAYERVPYVMKEVGIEKYEIIEILKGEELEGIEYVPALLEEVDAQREIEGAHKVVLSREYVNLIEGTGLVHIATGHGEEDYEVGLRYGLPVLMLVDDKGRFTKDAGKYAGMYIRDANKIIIEDLKRKGLLLYATTVRHKYPVCWRCKTPLILRATQQWLIKITALKDKVLEEAEKIDWIPKEVGSVRFKNWLRGLRDWVISRQRYWGTPLPIWVCEKCGNITVIGSKDELIKLSYPKVKSIPDLHKPWVDKITIKCNKCGSLMRRVPDVIDVWLDSGISFFASLGYPKNKQEFEKWMPVDFIVEGHDQYSGWFFSLLKSGVIGFNKVPYKVVLVHGFVLDEKGREMHKSLGNYVAPQEVINKYGRDILRLYVLSNTTWEDLRFSWKGLKEILTDLKVIWNVYVFASLYMNLDRFTPVKYSFDEIRKHLRPEDLWLLSRLNTMLKEVTNYLDNYLVHEVARVIRRFLVEDLSHWYVRLIRRRVWIEKEDPLKISAYYVLYKTLKVALKVLSLFTPFIAEKIYQNMFRTAEPGLPESIHMLPWPKPEEEWINKELEEEMNIVRSIVESSAAARMKAKIKIRQPLSTLYIISDDDLVKRAVNKLYDVVKSQTNVHEVKIVEENELERYCELRITPHRDKIRELCEDYEQLINELLKNKPLDLFWKLKHKRGIKVMVKGKEYILNREYMDVIFIPKEGFSVSEFNKGVVAITTQIKREELLEGIARDLIRRIQYMRKELDLSVQAYISTLINTTDSDIIEALKVHNEYIKSETRSKTIELKTEIPKDYYTKSWNINGKKVIIGIKGVPGE